jgi:hypothetical protein
MLRALHRSVFSLADRQALRLIQVDQGVDNLVQPREIRPRSAVRVERPAAQDFAFLLMR